MLPFLPFLSNREPQHITQFFISLSRSFNFAGGKSGDNVLISCKNLPGMSSSSFPLPILHHIDMVLNWFIQFWMWVWFNFLTILSENPLIDMFGKTSWFVCISIQNSGYIVLLCMFIDPKYGNLCNLWNRVWFVLGAVTFRFFLKARINLEVFFHSILIPRPR